jgi:anti-sigma factor RsiW
MPTCESAETLILQEVDGLLADQEAAALESHAAGCDACRTRRQASLDVARALALRVDAPVPSGFAARVAARAFPEVSPGWLDGINWRRWTEWMLPVAATLLVVAVVVGNRGALTTTDSTDEAETESTAAAADVWALAAEGDAATGAARLSADVSSEDLLATMLGTTASEKEGTSDGR